jgi:hypothetical protein
VIFTKAEPVVTATESQAGAGWAKPLLLDAIKWYCRRSALKKVIEQGLKRGMKASLVSLYTIN